MSFRTGEIIGAYEVVDRIGRGGAGEVFRVRHIITRRTEAIKVLSGRAGEREQAQRFLREIQIQASLSHPNIASVHNAFWAGDDLVMVMELVEGEPLRRILERGRLPLETALDYAGQALSALDYAHAHRVTHRDITPANMLVTAAGAVKLTDFGLAKSPADSRLTQTGAVLGSLYYMSPEQVQASPNLDERSDIYSLGAVLYEMVTGTKPFDGDSAFAIMSAHVNDAARAPAVVDPAVPPGLSEVILQAMAKERERRFASAREFRAALEAVPRVRLKKSATRVAWRWCAGAVAALVGVFLLTWDRREAPPAPVARVVAATSVETKPLKRDPSFRKIRSISMGASAWAVGLSPSGKWLAAGMEDGVIELWNIATGEKIGALRGHRAGVSAVCFSRDEQWLVSGGADRAAKIWDLRKKTGRESFRASGFVTSVALSGDGRWLAAGSSDRRVKLWNVKQGGSHGIKEKTEPAALAFNSSGSEIAVAGDHGVTFWNVHDARMVRVVERAGVRALAFGADGRFLSLRVTSESLKLWDVGTSRELGIVQHHGPVRAVAVGQAGRMLAFAESRVVSVWGL